MEEKSYFDNTKEIIDPNIHTCLYFIVKYLFLGKDSLNRDNKKKLENFIGRVKLDIYLNQEACNIENMRKIFNYIKKQNFLLASEIFENIIIKVLSLAFNAESDEFFGKHLYNNIASFKKEKKDLVEWFINDSLKPLLKNYSLIHTVDADQVQKDNDSNESNGSGVIFKNSTFLQTLHNINNSRRIIFNEKKNNNKDLSITMSSDMTTTFSHASEYMFDKTKNFGKKKKEDFLTPSMSILISTYIYYQNKNSPLMNFSKDSRNLINLPYTYELSEAGINDNLLDTILKPVRIEQRIEDIGLSKNKVQVKGILELHKAMIFNKRIKRITINSCSLKSIDLASFVENFKLFKNKSIEELSISSNYLKSDADIYLYKLISCLTELKTLNISFNIVKSGVASLFSTLKNLYRQKKSKIETLILINCFLDDISFYELGELLKSKYCQLKCLCLNENKIPSDVNFFKALKKNRSLEEIYFYGCKINSDKTDEIERIISNSNLECLYLYSNQIHDFNQYIRILYRNSLIKNKNEEKEEKEEKENNLIYLKPCLYNLNMNNYDCYNQNWEKLKLMLNGIEKTSLTCLDISSVLKDPSLEANDVNYKYYKGIENIMSYLKKKQDEYMKALREILESEVDIKKIKKVLGNNRFNEINEAFINDIINDNNSIYLAFIRDRVKEYIQNSADFSINNREEKRKKLENYVNYICLKRAESILRKNEKIRNQKKLIVI